MADFISNDEAAALQRGMGVESAIDREFEAIDTVEQTESQVGQELPSDLHFIQTSTTNPARPRTLRAAYDSKEQTMYVVFNDTTYWYYAGVDPETWNGFKSATSKGKFLHENGFDAGIYDMGPVDLSTMSPRRRAALTANLERSRRQQQALKGKQSTKLGGKGVRYRLRGQGGVY
jgi:hypothetical protein